MSAIPPLIPGSCLYKTVQTDVAKINEIVGDAVAEFSQWKGTVEVATTANITLTAAQTIDGVAVVAGDIVLVKDQTDATENGLYYCSASAWYRTLTMPEDSDASGAAVYVSQGTSNGDKVFVCTNNPGSAVVGTDNLVFAALVTSPAGSDTQVQFNDSGVMAGDSGLTFNKTTNVLTAQGGLVATTGGVTATAGGVTATAGGVTATAGNITATAGNIVASAGSVSAATTVTAGTGVTATTGGVTAAAGNIVATLGNISTSAGSISSATTVTAGTGVTATTGDITATAGSFVASTATEGLSLTKLTGTAANYAAGVTVVARQGVITVTDASLAADTVATLVVTATGMVSATDIILVGVNSIVSTDGAPVVYVSARTAPNSFTIAVKNADEATAMPASAMTIGYVIL